MNGVAEKLKKAKSKITAAIVGLVVMALVWLIWRLTLIFLGIGTTGPDEAIFELGD